VLVPVFSGLHHEPLCRSQSDNSRCHRRQTCLRRLSGHSHHGLHGTCTAFRCCRYAVPLRLGRPKGRRLHAYLKPKCTGTLGTSQDFWFAIRVAPACCSLRARSSTLVSQRWAGDLDLLSEISCVHRSFTQAVGLLPMPKTGQPSCLIANRSVNKRGITNDKTPFADKANHTG
jgi:hypothetical protein